MRPPPQTSYCDFGEHGLSTEEIAELEGCSPSRIRTIIAKALAKLRHECEKRHIKPEDLFGPITD